MIPSCNRALVNGTCGGGLVWKTLRWDLNSDDEDAIWKNIYQNIQSRCGPLFNGRLNYYFSFDNFLEYQATLPQLFDTLQTPAWLQISRLHISSFVSVSNTQT
jgi:hypothetical protein